MEKKQRFKAIIVTTILLLIVVLFPLISWYYLRTGLEWRKKAQDVMEGDQPLPPVEFADETGLKFSPKSLEYHVTLLSFLPCMEITEYRTVLDEIYKQFRETNKANFLLLDSCGIMPSAFADPERKKWFVVPCTDSTSYCQEISASWPMGASFALVDRKGHIRSYYPIRTKEERKILVEHMALLLPRERQEKVELKRGEKK